MTDRSDAQETTIAEHQVPAMHEREIELEDGRYMIFYTFGEAAEPAAESDV